MSAMRVVNVLLAVLVSAAICLLVLEGGLRLLGFGPPASIHRFDPALGWSKVPGAVCDRSGREFTATFEINEQGLRDDPMALPDKAPGTYRVAMLGDSFTLGYTVERDHLFVDLLERKWASEGRKIDVVNAGTEAWSTDQEVIWLMEHGQDFDPDLVLLFPFDNDLYWNAQTAYRRYSKPRFEADGSLEPRVLEDPGEQGWIERLGLARFLAVLSGASGEGDHRWSPDGGKRTLHSENAALLHSPPDFMVGAIGRTRGALSALRAECGRLGAELLVVPIPSKACVHEEARARVAETMASRGLAEGSWLPEQPVETFLALCGELGIRTLDARASLEAAAAEGGADLYYQRDWHFNPAGNLAFAGFLDRELDAAGLFPAAHAAQTAGEFPALDAGGGGVPFAPVLYLTLLVVLVLLYKSTYRAEPLWKPVFGIAALLAVIFGIVFAVDALVGVLPPQVAQLMLITFVLLILMFVAFKMGSKVGTVLELFRAFVARGHWYLMPLVVVLLTVGSLLVVAASSPLVAPFIYTLF